MVSSSIDDHEMQGAEALGSEFMRMASVTLKGIKKIYPFSGDDNKKKKKKKKDDEAPQEGKPQLTVTDQGVVAVHDFNLEIKDKEFIVLVGPSGCGKSTTLRMVAGLEEISEGELYIGNRLVNDVAPKDRDIAMVFQNYALYPHMTVYENMAFALKLRKVPKDEIDKKVKQAAEILDITQYLGRKPKALSGGQRQRVAIGRAIVRDPQVFLMDEPLSNLDAKLRVDMRSELKRLHHDTGSTIIYVTHDQVEALTMSTKIALFREGELVQVDKPLELYDNPCDLYTADFIGNPSINFVEASGTAGASGLSVDGVMGRLEFSREDMTPEAPASGDLKLVLGIRPEQITISREKTDAAQVEARVYAGMPAGSETLVSVRVGEKLITVKELGSTHYAGDETVYLSYPPKKVNVFDASTKRLIKYSR